jgi:hypothetical protein
VGVGVGVVIVVFVGVIVISGTDVGAVVAFVSGFASHPTNPAKKSQKSNRLPALKKAFIRFIFGLLFQLTVPSD